jgi:hypothetical protein
VEARLQPMGFVDAFLLLMQGFSWAGWALVL